MILFRLHIDGIVKLCGFEHARAIYPVFGPTFGNSRIAHSPHAGSLWCRPLEILLGANIFTPAADIWATGTLMSEMLTGIPLIYSDSQIDSIYRIFQIFGTPNEADWNGVTSLPYWNPA